jgi:hypothetical protein
MVLGSSSGTSQGEEMSIFYLTHDIHQTVTRSIDTALSWDQLNSPSVNYTLVRPIVERFVQARTAKQNADQDDSGRLRARSEAESGGESHDTGGDAQLGAVLYALMANRQVLLHPCPQSVWSIDADNFRIQFINLAEGDLSYAPLQNARAAFCELLASKSAVDTTADGLIGAVKVLRSFPDLQDEANVAEALVHGWSAFGGAPKSVWDSMGEDKREVEDATGSALEVSPISAICCRRLPGGSHASQSADSAASYRLVVQAFPIAPSDPASDQPNLHWPPHLPACLLSLSDLRLIRVRPDDQTSSDELYVPPPVSYGQPVEAAYEWHGDGDRRALSPGLRV